MDKMKLLAELTMNCNGKKEKLLGMLEYFDLANLGYDLQKQRCKDVHNRVLAKHEFKCAKEFSRGTGYKIGDRITDESMMFLLSDEDFHRLMELSRPIMVEEGITDENGFYIEPWAQKRSDARHGLISFILDEILPKTLKETLEPCRWNVVWQDKLINAFKSCVKKAA